MSDVIRKILVPTDFSSYSDAALYTAASLAKRLEAKVLLLNIVDIPGYAYFNLKEDLHTTNLEKIATNVASERLKRLKRSPELKGTNLEIKIRSGNTYKTILDESKKISADLIIMGTKGISGFEKLLIGSNTERVINLSSIPVLSVKETLDIDKVKNIAFASSFNQEYSFSFPSIYQFMEIFNARLHLLKVITAAGFEPTYLSHKNIEDFAASFRIIDYEKYVINDDTVEEGLDWFCNDKQIDVLFMTTHGKRGLSHLFSGSHTENMSQRYSIPIFSIKMLNPKLERGVIFPHD